MKFGLCVILAALYLHNLLDCCLSLTLDSESKTGSNRRGLTLDDYTTLSAGQRNALEQLKVKILPKMKEDFMKNDLYILKFLSAKNFDGEKAELFLLNHINWWEENQMNKIHEEDWSDLEKEYPYSIEGQDRQGRPLLLTDFGQWNVGKATEKGELEKLLRYYDKMLNDAQMKVMQLQGEGKNVTEWLSLVDQDGVSIDSHVNLPSSRFYWHAATRLENNHPGMTTKVYLLKSPGIFDAVMGIVRPIMSEQTNDILKTFGDEKEWKGLVDELVDPSQLPPSYGGTKGTSTRIVNSFQRNKDGSWSWVPSWLR